MGAAATSKPISKLPNSSFTAGTEGTGRPRPRVMVTANSVNTSARTTVSRSRELESARWLVPTSRIVAGTRPRWGTVMPKTSTAPSATKGRRANASLSPRCQSGRRSVRNPNDMRATLSTVGKKPGPMRARGPHRVAAAQHEGGDTNTDEEKSRVDVRIPHQVHSSSTNPARLRRASGGSGSRFRMACHADGPGATRLRPELRAVSAAGPPGGADSRAFPCSRPTLRDARACSAGLGRRRAVSL